MSEVGGIYSLLLTRRDRVRPSAGVCASPILEDRRLLSWRRFVRVERIPLAAHRHPRPVEEAIRPVVFVDREPVDRAVAPRARFAVLPVRDAQVERGWSWQRRRMTFGPQTAAALRPADLRCCQVMLHGLVLSEQPERQDERKYQSDAYSSSIRVAQASACAGQSRTSRLSSARRPVRKR